MNETFLETISTEKNYSAKERRALILKLMNSNNEVSVNELSLLFHTSTVTIRKDLTILQQRNLLNRTRGGAIRKPVENLNEDSNIAKKRMFNAQEKERIGRAAAKLIRNGDLIML
ncbi:MAG: DeoR family transcriptional regulator, partial [Paludibacteraceae bacterium]